MATMRIVLIALGTGIATGAFFRALKLPLPAPPTAAGVAGIIGIFIGSKIMEYILK